jgi:hypothetical protein
MNVEKSVMDAKQQGLQNPECYARALGGCSREMSGEHYVSKGILELVECADGSPSSTVRVTGLAFQQPGQLQRLGVASLVGNILCKRHNERLSCFDDAGKAVFQGMDDLNNAAGDATMPERVVRVDGDGLERWMLKTLCGGLYSGAFRVSETETMKGVQPPSDWLDVLYNGKEMPPGLGLYFMTLAQDQKVTTDHEVFKVEPLGSVDGPEVGGLQVWFFGFWFVLLMAGLKAGVPTMFDLAMYRPAGFRARGSNVRIQFDWEKGQKREDVLVVFHGEGRWD